MDINRNQCEKTLTVASELSAPCFTVILAGQGDTSLEFPSTWI